MLSTFLEIPEDAREYSVEYNREKNRIEYKHRLKRRVATDRNIYQAGHEITTAISYRLTQSHLEADFDLVGLQVEKVFLDENKENALFYLRKRTTQEK